MLLSYQASKHNRKRLCFDYARLVIGIIAKDTPQDIITHREEDWIFMGYAAKVTHSIGFAESQHLLVLV